MSAKHQIYHEDFLFLKPHLVMDPTSRPVSDQQPMTKKSETLLIATSTIGEKHTVLEHTNFGSNSLGGAILIVFVIYIIVRMRRGATLVDVLKLRRAGTEQIVDTNDYPIQWEQRYSVRSSHHPSLTIATRRQRNMPPLVSLAIANSCEPRS